MAGGVVKLDPAAIEAAIRQLDDPSMPVSPRRVRRAHAGKYLAVLKRDFEVDDGPESMPWSGVSYILLARELVLAKVSVGFWNRDFTPAEIAEGLCYRAERRANRMIASASVVVEVA
jgi:hypothetical protein